MLSASTSLKNVYRNDYTVKIGNRVIIENNMNSMIDGITVTSKDNASEYVAPLFTKDANGADIPWPTGKPNPFKKLFPLDSIIKPFRPIQGGVKYFVMPEVEKTVNADGSVTKSSTVSIPYTSPRSQVYGNDEVRYYYPGVSNPYKYWLAPVGKDVDLTVRYKQTQATWDAAKLNGDIPSTSGSIPMGNKSALVNKIYVNFDMWQTEPESCSIIVEKADGTLMTEVTYEMPTSFLGVVEFYYNGTTWTTTEPSTYHDPILINSINLKAVCPDIDIPDLRIAVIEVSGRCIKDVPESGVEFLEINKEASTSSSDLLPVGFVNSNTLSAKFSDFNQTTLTFKDYNRYSTSFANQAGVLNPNVVFLTKNSKVTPYIKTYHDGGQIGSSPNKYDLTMQGVFYLDTYFIDEFGSAEITCLDGSKHMMDTLCPDLFLTSYPATAVLRVLLDNIGFTSYNFNIKPTAVTIDGESQMIGPDKSIPIINYWWTAESQTVWEAIQTLCRDIQMNAFFDESGTLQFYSRDYIYSQDVASWTFRYDAFDYIDNTTPGQPVSKRKLPNIISFSKEEIASANQVKILWTTPMNSNYLSNSTYLWQSPATYLAAGGLRQKLPNPTAKVTGAVANGTTVTYTSAHTYSVGQVVNITGLTPSQFNLSNAKIIAATDSTFTVSSNITGTFVRGGSPSPTATITGAAYSNGFTTYTAQNSFAKGEKVSISSKTILPVSYALATPTIIVEATPTTFKVASRPKGSSYVSGGTASTGSYGTATVTTESTALFLNINSIDTYQTFQSIFNFNGYFLIDSEIIEFDAIQYQYTPELKDDGTPNDSYPILTKLVWIETATDISKYRSLSKNGFADDKKPETAYFKPTGSYRIKKRGALGTSPAFHNATSDKPASAWTAKQVKWTSK